MFKSLVIYLDKFKLLDDVCQGFLKNKCMKKTEGPNLPHIKAHHITKLASTAKVDWSYVWMIVNGKREANSTRSKAILQAATTLNKHIERGLTQANKELILIGEND